MPSYSLPPGAWLSPPSSASLHPPIKPRGASTALDLLGAALHPEPRSRVGLHPEPKPGGPGTDATWHPEPQGGNSAVRSDDVSSGSGALPWPWQGLDPAWVYAGGDETLLAQALRRMQSKVVRPVDTRRGQPAPVRLAERPADAALGDAPLWRWASEYRVRAVTADLSGRFFVERKTLWLVTRSGGAAPALQARQCISLQGPRLGKTYDQQVDKVRRAAVEREERLPEILTQASDLWSFFNTVTGIDAVAAPGTAELFDVAWQWAELQVMALKNQLAEPRPVQRSSMVTPVIPTPGHGSLPSGHATMSALTAELLIRLLYDDAHERAAQLDRLVRRIAFNRVVAGVHFPMDSAAGYRLGRQLAGLFAALALGERAPKGDEFNADDDTELVEDTAREPLVLAGARLRASPLLQPLWARAARELQALRV